MQPEKSDYMLNSSYKNRVVDSILKERLEEVGAVLVQGPKWCGKTTTCEQQSRSQVMLANIDEFNRSRQLLETNAGRLLAGETPRLFDEWQTLPKLWDAIRYEVDHRHPSNGHFILTGSAVPVHSDEILHSGTGRFAWIQMRPMSLWESGESTGEVSLTDLFRGTKSIDGESRHNLEDIAFLLCRGGWPDALDKSERVALRVAYNYVDALVNADISRIDETLRNPRRVRLLMRSLGRLQGTQTSINVIRQDLLANDESTLSETTVSSYLNTLQKLFAVEDMPAWSTHLRSKTAIRTSNTRYYSDPSIAVAALGLTPSKLMDDLNTFGLLFETLAVRDLRVYADAIDGQVFHYRDKDGLECDAVIELRDGTYGLIEIKLGGETAIREAQLHLMKLEQKIDSSRVGKAAFRMVLTAVGNYAYRLDDDTLVVPIGCLKP